MKIAVVGGGPGGLYFAALAKQLNPAHEITIWERNAPDDTFGFGVVFSDETLGGIENADTEFGAAMAERFARWTDIDIHYRGQSLTVGGQGFAAMSRKELLALLQERVRPLGVTVRFATQAPDAEELRATHDLVVAADGANSRTRAPYADVFRPDLDRRHSKYMWLGTDRVFEAFQFFIKQTQWGTMQVHGYPYSGAGSTFIVEMHEDVWRRAGFDATESTDLPPGTSDRLRHRPAPRAVRRRARRTRAVRQQLEVAELHHRPQPALAPRQPRARRRRRAHRALLDRVGHQAGDGGLPRARGLPARAPGRPDRARRLRGRAPPGGRVDAARGPGVPRVVREHRHVHAQRARAVLLQPADPVPADHLRQPPGTGRGVRRARQRRLQRGPGRRERPGGPARCSSRSGWAASS